MNYLVDLWIDKNSYRIIESLRESICFASVQGTTEPNAPFGREVADALRHVLGKAKDLGLETCNMEGYIGYAEYGSGEETLGVLTHLDVVPAGDGWKYDPFGAELINGRIYGRGALDDKGPAIAALFALTAIKELGLNMKRKVRILFGCNEESGWKCIEYYKKHRELPEIAFSPDGEYPLVNSEKSICQITFKKKYRSSITVHSGMVANVVPSKAIATVPILKEDILPIIRSCLEGSGYGYELSPYNEGTQITVMGVAAHASKPETGKNALQALLSVLALIPITGEDRITVAALRDAFKQEYYGESIGLNVSDDSGRLTINVGVLHWDHKGISELTLDLRCPINLQSEYIYDSLISSMALWGASCISYNFKPGHYISEDSELVSKLLNVYAERTGKWLPPLKIGGGTYARCIDNAVAFGPLFPEDENLVHMANEYISIDNLIFQTKMIADAIIELATDL